MKNMNVPKNIKSVIMEMACGFAEKELIRKYSQSVDLFVQKGSVETYSEQFQTEFDKLYDNFYNNLCLRAISILNRK